MSFCLFAVTGYEEAVALSRRNAEQRGEIVERDEPVRINHVPSREDDTRHNRRPNELAF